MRCFRLQPVNGILFYLCEVVYGGIRLVKCSQRMLFSYSLVCMNSLIGWRWTLVDALS